MRFSKAERVNYASPLAMLGVDEIVRRSEVYTIHPVGRPFEETRHQVGDICRWADVVPPRSSRSRLSDRCGQIDFIFL